MTDQTLYQLADVPDGKPVSLAELHRMAKSGEITRYSFIRPSDGGKWMTADQMDELPFEDSPSAEATAAPTAPERDLASKEQAAGPPETVATTGSAQQVLSSSNETRPAGRPRRRFRLWFVVTTLAVLVIVPAAGWYFLSPTPVDRFEQFAAAAREQIVAKVDEKMRAKFRGYFQYNVRETDPKESLVSPYRAEIVFWGGQYLAEYRYDYRHGKWVCMGAKFHLSEGKVKIVQGPELRETDAGKVLTACGRY